MKGVYAVVAPYNGQIVAVFASYGDADTFARLNGCRVSRRKSTEKQRKAVKWAEEILLAHGENNAKFTGNIDDPMDCHYYLNEWLQEAKDLDYYEQEIIRDNLGIADEWIWKD